ncbi:Cut8-domain-containing protein [Byssothecium circinans]|uniref:Tethering factor for nuclear proteasome STS1 n=1 Tax=Byssothecium circinans TaxID=147558 RepID=A0A6A5TS05_9PLEO|nr:Cut8-domain-containing protein [Byssothecium circinans]
MVIGGHVWLVLAVAVAVASALALYLTSLTLHPQQHINGPLPTQRRPVPSRPAYFDKPVNPSGGLWHVVGLSMNVINSHFAVPPHRLSPTRNLLSQPSMSSRKRKADDEGSSGGDDDRMSASPSGSPAVMNRPLPRQQKRMRTNISGRPLPLPRLLETLSADEMRTVLQSICDRHPAIGNEVVNTAPRPSVQSTLDVLAKYFRNFEAAFPFGGRASSDYAYNRVRQHLMEMLESLKDFTPHFLPPNESQPATSLAFLDGATDFIHRLPDWDNFQQNRHKQEAYEEMAKAWAAVIREAAKKAGGIQLQYGGWDQKISKHNEISGGRMQEAVNVLRGSLGWMGSEPQQLQPGMGNTSSNVSVRDQLLNGTYGMNTAGVGAW